LKQSQSRDVAHPRDARPITLAAVEAGFFLLAPKSLGICHLLFAYDSGLSLVSYKELSVIKIVRFANTI